MVAISDFLDALGFENMFLVAVFLISFALLSFILKGVFKRQFKESSNTITTIIAFCIAMLIVFGVNAMHLDLGSFFYDIGLESGVLEMIIYLVLLAGILFVFYKFGIAKTLMITAILLIYSSIFTTWFYEADTVFYMGVVIFFIALVLYFIGKKLKKKEKKAEDEEARIAKTLFKKLFG